MDTFFEQIVLKGRDYKTVLKFIGIWLLALVLCVAIFFFLAFSGILVLLIMGAVLFGAYKLSSMLYIEYEYIVVNGSLDIDKIIAKSSRKRIASFEISQVEVIEKYNPSSQKTEFDSVIIACDERDKNAYKMVVRKDGSGKQLIVFSPNEKIKGAILKALPRFVASSAFKD